MTRIAAAVAVLSLAACVTGGGGAGSAGHWSALPVLGPLEAGLLYHERSDTPLDPRLAFAWGKVCGEVDEEDRAQAVAAAQPRLRQEARRIAGQDAWRMPLRQSMGNYDLQRGGFPTGIRRGAVVRFGGADFCQQALSFLVAFRNGDAYALLRLPEERAKELVRTDPSRAVVHDLEVEVVGWQAGPPGATLLVDILRVRTRDAQTDRVVFDTAEAGGR